jgi:predicted RNase H-like HicB family nuclease
MEDKKVFKYPVIIEKAEGNYSAYSPDLPGCIATGKTMTETLSRMRSAIQFHIEGLKREGLEIPEPSTRIKYIDVSIL